MTLSSLNEQSINKNQKLSNNRKTLTLLISNKATRPAVKLNPFGRSYLLFSSSHYWQDLLTVLFEPGFYFTNVFLILQKIRVQNDNAYNKRR